MKKVLVVITTEFVPFGGLTTVMMNYYRAIDKSKYKIDFASTNKELDETLKVEINANESKYFWLGDRKRNLCKYIRELYFVLKNGEYQVIHVNANSATAAIELFIAKMVGVQIRIDHNHTSICNHKILHKILYPLLNLSYTDAVACSEKAGKWIFKNKRYTVLNNGIDTNKFRFNVEKRLNIRNLFGISEDTVVLGHVGKIYKPKNHDFLLHVFADYLKCNDSSVLLLVGDGELASEIKSLAKRLKIEEHVIFAGMQMDIAAYLSAMDIFIFPSLWEGLPLSLIEAQASGLNCIASENIDISANVTNRVKMLPINNGTTEWVNAINGSKKLDRDKSSEEQIQLLIKGGFDSVTNVEKLEGLYTKK